MCDTFVALQSTTTDGSVILAKNSDREANEMQSLEYFEGKKYAKNEKVKCTYIEIDQVERTNSILISRPFWMWGAEMGSNDKGVAIGNEAIWTKMAIHKKNDRLLGMDLLRLALERGNSAKEALDIISKLLEKYGQGGEAGFRDKSMAYHNSFLIADKNEAWVLETADYMWVAKKVKHYYSISNASTIGQDYDLSHPELISNAIEKGWHKKGNIFNFSKSYSDWFFTTFSGSKKRQHQTECHLEDSLKNISVLSSIKALQSHHKENYSPDSHLLGTSICAHAGNSLSRDASQTTGSMIAHLNENPTFWFTATSSVCTSVFKPVWFSGNVLPKLGDAVSTFDKNTLWWKNELLHRLILLNYSKNKPIIEKELNILQNEIIIKTQNIVDNDKYKFTSEIFNSYPSMIERWIKMISKNKIMDNRNLIYKNYWNKLNKKAEIYLDSFF